MLQNKLQNENRRDYLEDLIVKKIRKVNRSQRLQILNLYQQADFFDETDDISLIDKIIKGSYAFFVVLKKDEIVAMARCLSDGVSDAYIQDVTVKKEFRGKGIGLFILSHIKTFLLKRGISWIGLIGAPGTEKFYELAGFEKMENFVPFILRIQGK